MECRKFIPLCISLLATAIIFTLQFSFVNSAKKSIPDSHCFTSKYGIGIDFDTMERASNNDTKSSLEHSISGGVRNINITNETTVDLVFTNSSYAKLTNLSIRYGTYFNVNPITEFNNCAVISDKLAIALFKTDKAIGQIIVINGREHTVSGVYLSNKNVFKDITSNGLERVYLPYKMLDDYRNANPNIMYATTNTTSFTQGLTMLISDSCNAQPMYNFIDNFTETRLVLDQSLKITLFYIGIVICVILLRNAYCRVRTLSFSIYEKKRSIISIGIATLLVAASISIFFLVKFEFFIPNDMLPFDNIFDFKFYYDMIVRNYNTHISLMVYNPFWNYSFVSIIVSTIYAVLNCISSTILLIHICKSLKEVAYTTV